MVTKLRVGMIGCGRMGNGHMHNLKALDTVNIVAVCDVLEATVNAAAATTGARPYQNAMRMLDEEDLDAVYVTTNTAYHADLGVAVLESGRNLFLEKPLAFNAQDAYRLTKTAKKHGQMHAVGHQWRYLQGVDVAKKYLLNRPLSVVRLQYYWTWPLVSWIADRATGGGQVMDQGIHLLDLGRYFAGNVVEVYAQYTLNARKDDAFPNWDGQVVAGRFDGGAVLSLTTTYALFQEITPPAQVDLVSKEILVSITPDETRIMTPNKTTIYKESVPSSALQDQAFVQACLNNDDSLIRSTIFDASQSLSVVLAANQSAAKGQIVAVS